MWLWKSEKTYVRKRWFCNPSTCICENGKYSRSVIGDSVIMCDEITGPTNTVPRKCYKKK